MYTYIDIWTSVLILCILYLQLKIMFIYKSKLDLLNLILYFIRVHDCLFRNVCMYVCRYVWRLFLFSVDILQNCTCLLLFISSMYAVMQELTTFRLIPKVPSTKWYFFLHIFWQNIKWYICRRRTVLEQRFNKVTSFLSKTNQNFSSILFKTLI